MTSRTCFTPDLQYNYSPIESKVFCNESQLGMFETYGEDLKLIKEFFLKYPKRIWSCMDSDLEGEGDIVFKTGLQEGFIIYYVIIEEEWEAEDESYYLVQ